jgi:DNA-binding transcriptional MerR regulator
MGMHLTIGDFARMTHLSVKALRHYHEVGILVPTDIDPATGYRHYDLSQVTRAQVIRRFRDLAMPLDELRTVLQAEDVEGRNRAIVAHLERMERQLEQTQSTVASLRALLERPQPAPMVVEFRRAGPVCSLAIRERVAVSDFVVWWGRAFKELRAALGRSSAERAGPDSALYSSEFFEEEVGEVVAFVPIRDEATSAGRVEMMEIPAAELAVTLHEGSFEDLDQAYAALGAYVAERAIGVEGPIREHYIVSPFSSQNPAEYRTEVGWPVFFTG